MHIERVEGASYLATSNELPGLVAEGRTVQETTEIAQDVARRIFGSCRGQADLILATCRCFGDTIDLDIPITA